MNLTESKLIEQLTFRILTFQDPVKAQKYIFDCMCDTAYLTPEQVSSTQALFLEVTTYLGTFDKDYSMECSIEYLKLIKENFGDTSAEELIRKYKKGEKDE